jgi:hypothetical protein
MREITKAFDVGLILVSIGLVINFLNSPGEFRSSLAAFHLLDIIGGLSAISYGMKRLEENGLYYIVSGISAIILGFFFIA